MFCGAPRKGPKGRAVRCNKCASCVESKRRDFVTRVLLELSEFPESTYITLDISPDSYPSSKAEALAQIKRFLRGVQFRSVFVPERGSQGTRRLHWHGIVFGVPYLDLKSSLALWEPRWPFGGVTVRRADPQSGRYIAKYVSGGPLSEDVANFYDGIGHLRVRWCRSPALACGQFIERTARLYEGPGNGVFLRERVAISGDVIGVFRSDGKTISLPRPVKVKLRERLNIPSSCPVRDEVMSIQASYEKENPAVVARLKAKRESAHAVQVERRRREWARAIHLDPHLLEAERLMRAAVRAGKYVPVSVRRSRKARPPGWARITPRVRRVGSQGSE